jgi:hypothetical protein
VSQTVNNKTFCFEIAAGLKPTYYLALFFLFTAGVGCAVRTMVRMTHPARCPIVLFFKSCSKYILGVCFVINVLQY